MLRWMGLAVFAAGSLTACTSNPLTPSEASQVIRLAADVDELQEQLQAVTARLNSAMTDQAAGLETLKGRLNELPEEVASQCRQRDPTQPVVCEPGESTLVVGEDGKMLVGELEHVWLDPPGVAAVARIDTGAQSSSMHGDDMVEFERDGEDWVRFSFEGQRDEPLTIERPVLRYVRVYQQADPSGSRRPVINMRIKLGNVEDTFEFTLADRSHLDYQVLLGRNFLTDVALVDVARQFVQPAGKVN